MSNNWLYTQFGAIKNHNISKLIKKTARQKILYNFGWGNLNSQMIVNKLEFPEINNKSLSIYSSEYGMDSTREDIAKFVNSFSNRKISSSNILVTNGTTNGISIVSHYFKHILGYDKIIVQNPTYDTALNIFRAFEIAEEASDLYFDSHKNISESLFYGSFKFQNPTGIYIPSKDNDIVANLLSNNNYFIEDDCYGLLNNFPEIDIRLGKHVYLGSFSKYLFPSIRLGWIVASEDIIQRFSIIQKFLISHPNPISQAIVSGYIQSGKIIEEINWKREYINNNRKVFEQNLSKAVLNAIEYCNGGFYYWIRLNDNIDFREVYVELINNGILTIPGIIYDASGADKLKALRISIAQIDPLLIAKGASLLNELLFKYVG